MMSSPDWAQLYKTGNCKAFGIPWTEEEVAYITESGVWDMERVQELRAGLEIEQAKKTLQELDTPKTKLIQMSKEELKTKAKELGLSFSEETKRFELLRLVREAQLNSEPTLPVSEEAPQES